MLFQHPSDPFTAVRSQRNLFVLGSYGCGSQFIFGGVPL